MQEICREDIVETVKSSHFEEDKDTSSEKNLAIEKFISVRRDLFDSSVSEDSVIKNEISEPEAKSKVNSLKNLDCDKTVKCVNGITVYQCLKCPKSFNKWKNLYLHNRLHNKNYCCPIVECGKKFATKGDLEKHIRTHTGEKPYQCDQCDKSFAQRGTLKSHKESVHSEEALKKCASNDT
ncbi:zinc finger protein 813-like [Melitaea cinxia]|uniref:zinc finger protein 813-like n=1 Tax=Melitaea cinxia TaxID=113334 RepID=UPI001E27347F|nr:zinc finger protein 813-like [Melitaea cinxia]